MGSFFVLNDTATTESYTYRHTLSRHDALPSYVAEPDAARGHDDTNDGILWELGNQRFDSRGCCRFRDSRERPGGRPGHHSAQGLFGDAGRGPRRRSFAGLFGDRPVAGAAQARALPSHRPAAAERPALWPTRSEATRL